MVGINRTLLATLKISGLNLTSSESTAVTFGSSTGILRVSCDRECLPRPWVSVEVGVRSDGDSANALVALWRVFPEAQELQDPENLTFTTQADLDDRLVLLRDEWLPRYVLPALASEEVIFSALAEQEREVFREYESLKHQQHVRRARESFDREDFEDAVLSYALADIESLSAADQRRLVAARKRLSQS